MFLCFIAFFSGCASGEGREALWCLLHGVGTVVGWSRQGLRRRAVTWQARAGSI